MKPLPMFSLHRPEKLREALELLQSLDEAKPIAGGTDLLILLRDGAIRATNLVDLNRVEELRYIRESDGTISIGTLTTFAHLLMSELITEKVPVLREAVMSMGSVQIRNQGTVGGNLCNASPAADTAPPLLVLEASATIVSPEAARSIPIADIFAGPKINSLSPSELLTKIEFQVPPANSGASFHKLGRRRSLTLSLVNAAAYVALDGELCREARLALGAVAPTPLRMPQVEEMLKGEKLSGRLIKEAASACRGLVDPVDDVRASAEYRREMVCVLTRRALTDAWEKARRSPL